MRSTLDALGNWDKGHQGFFILVTLLLPGAGLVMSNRMKAGIFLFTLSLLLDGFGLWSVYDAGTDPRLGLVMFAVSIILHIVVVSAVFYTARNRIMLSQFYSRRRLVDPYCALFLTLMLPGSAHLLARRGIPLGLLLVLGFILVDNSEVARLASLLVSVVFSLALLRTLSSTPLFKNVRAFFLLALILLPRVIWSQLIAVSFPDRANFLIVGQSMSPTLHVGDHTIVGTRDSIRRGSIIAFQLGNQITPFAKRVVGIQGDSIEYRETEVWITTSHRVHKFPRIVHDEEVAPKSTKLEIGQNEFYVVGDNVLVSVDSREFGLVRKRDIIGVVRTIFWPPSRARVVPLMLFETTPR